jgi:hypothetical protein
MVRYLTAIIILAVSLSTWTQAATYGGGSGTAESPYEIWTPEQMNTIGANSDDWNKHFKLMADIDMSAYTGTQYNIIGTDYNTPFTGTFNGNEHKISHLTYVTTVFAEYVGLFGYAENAVIQNLHIENITISAIGRDYERVNVGGLVGENNNGDLTNCSMTGSITITGGSSSVGGIAGSNYGLLTDCHAAGSVYGTDGSGGLAGSNSGIITNCYAVCSVEGVTDTGGLVGTNWEGIISQSYATGSVHGLDSCTGGLVGYNVLEKSTITACYATGSVSGTDSVGGLVGYLGDSTITHCYATGQVSSTGTSVGGLVGSISSGYGIAAMCFWDTQTSGQAASAGGTGKTTAQMQNLATYMVAGWDFVYETFNGAADSWTISPGHYPYLAWQTGITPPQTAIMPDVLLMTQANAESAVEAAGLAVWTNSAFSDTVPAGSVVNQQPSAGTVLLANMPVNIEVSIGPNLNPGTGTQNDPYKIASVADWQALMSNPNNWNKSFVLINDLDLRYVTLTPIGNSEIPFTGSLDGSGHSIRNAVINTSESVDVGLFGRIGSVGQISNLGLESINVTGRAHVGGMAGYNEGVISNCHVQSTINGTNGFIGGLAGTNDGLIVSCHTSGSVNGESSVGGLAGVNHNMLIGCYSDAAVFGSGIYSSGIGGLVGDAVSSTIINCFAAGSANGSSAVGGLIGANSNVSMLINCCSNSIVSGTGSHRGGLVGWSDEYTTAINCFWDMEASGQATSAAGTGKTTAQMQTLATFTEAGWDFTGQSADGLHDFWQMTPGDYPRLTTPVWTLAGGGTSGNPYIVANVADLGKVWLRPSSCYRLGSNINLTGISWSSAVVPAFNGIFDGQGFVISNLTIHQPDMDDTGLFGSVNSGGQIQNLRIEDVNIVGLEHVGGLAGNNEGVLTNCYATGLISGTECVGGLVGGNISQGILSGCHADGSITGTGQYQCSVGGLVGYNSGNLLACYADGVIQAIGENPPDVYYYGHYVGGLVGSNHGTLNACYAAASVSLSHNGFVGGLVGQNQSGVINSCYAVGLVIGINGNTGGLAASDYYAGTAVNSFWDIQTTGQATSAGGTGKTTAEMKTLSTFTSADWDFVGETANGTNDYWQMAADDYPCLALDAWTPDGLGTADSPYIIADSTDLGRVWLRPSACYRLDNNLDLTGISWSSAVVPVFRGDFDGQGHIVSHLTMNQPDCDNIGLFGSARGMIHNLGIENVNITGKSRVGGLAGETFGLLSDCYVTGFVSGNSSVGGLTGSNGGTITACRAASSVYGNSSVGGLTGSNSSAITACYATGSVYGNSNVGGLAGFAGGQLSACYATGMVSGVENVGGLVGQNNWAALSDCYASGPVSGSNRVGGLVGYASNPNLVVNSCFWDVQTSGQEASAGGTGKTTAQMQDINTFLDADWDFTTADDDPADWVMLSTYYPQLASFPLVSIPDVVGLTQANAQSAIQSAGLSMGVITFVSSQTVPAGVVISQSLAEGMQVNPGMVVNLVVSLGFYDSGAGTPTDPYQISSRNNLLILAVSPADYDKCFILTADIDMEGQVFNTAIITPDTKSSEYGFEGTAFTGIFDGNNHKITHFTIEDEQNNCLGLFGQIGSGGRVKNLGIENCSINGSFNSSYVGSLCAVNNGMISNCYSTCPVNGCYSVGGLCGQNGGSISNCYATGNVSGENDPYCLGGLCGRNMDGAIDKCYAAGNISGHSTLGGLCGASYGKGIIKNSYATGTVIGSSSFSYDIGGLCGYNETLIYNCYATGTVSGESDIGGLCGFNFNILRDCYATGDVAGGNESYCLGGLCGVTVRPIITCYATGSVSGGSVSYNLGGLCGSIGSLVSHCYATGAVTGGDNAYALGGLVGENSGWIKDSYAAGAVTGGAGAYDTGGFCGQNSEGQFDNCFWDVETSGQAASAGGIGKTTSQMQTRQTFLSAGWDFTNEIENDTMDIWRMCVDGIEYPKFAWQFAATGDLVCPAGVGMEDLSVFIGCWLGDCELKGDITLDDRVNMDDLQYVSLQWLLPDYEIGGPYSADVTEDTIVNLDDLIVVADQWLQVSCRRMDLTHDDNVNLADLSILAANWLKQ